MAARSGRIQVESLQPDCSPLLPQRSGFSHGTRGQAEAWQGLPALPRGHCHRQAEDSVGGPHSHTPFPCQMPAPQPPAVALRVGEGTQEPGTSEARACAGLRAVGGCVRDFQLLRTGSVRASSSGGPSPTQLAKSGAAVGSRPHRKKIPETRSSRQRSPLQAGPKEPKTRVGETLAARSTRRSQLPLAHVLALDRR